MLWLVGAVNENYFIMLVGFAGMTLTLLRRLKAGWAAIS